MPTPKVTVITPAYNVEQYLAEAMQSVLSQTEADLEYLVVDDGSTDGTAAIAREFATRDPRVRVLEGQHRGSSAARNVALRQAVGEFVSFCDGDDRWHPQFLERSLQVLGSAPPEVGAVFCAFEYIDERGRGGAKTQTAAPGDYDAVRTLAGHCPQGNGSCLVIRRSCFDQAGLFDEGLFNCVDFDMWMRIHLGSSSPQFRFIAEPLVDWRTRPGAISSNEAKRVDGLEEIFRRYGHILVPSAVADAYTWPAVLAYYSGRDEIAGRWTHRVRAADPRFFLRGQHGLVLGVFTLVGPTWGRRLRRVVQAAAGRVARLRIARKERRGARSFSGATPASVR